MKFLCLAALASLGYAQTPHYINLSGSQQTSFSLPSVTVSNQTYEGRVSGISITGSDKWIFDCDSFGVKVVSGTTNIYTIDHHDSVAVTVTNSNADIRFRVVRNQATSTVSLEIWPASGSQTGYALGKISYTPGSYSYAGSALIAGQLFASANGGQVGFVRAYSTATNIGVAPPAENPTAHGDLWDFEYENNLTDSSGRGITQTLNTGSPSYASNSTFNPIASFIAYVTTPLASYAVFKPAFKTGTSITVDGSLSFDSLYDTGVPTFSYSVSAGPMGGSFSSTSVPVPSFSATNAGDYTLALTVTDSLGSTGNQSLDVGAVNTSLSGVVSTGQGTLWDQIMGPVTIMGSSPYPYYDLASAEVADTNTTYGLANTPSLGSHLVGDGACSVQVTNNPVSLIGNGHCNFLTVLAGGHDCSAIPNSCPIVAWTTVDGAGTGRYVFVVDTVTDDNHASSIYFDTSITVGSGFPLYSQGVGTKPSDPWMCGGNSANDQCIPYYDNAIALYRLYYRTGLTDYLTKARAYADTWWEWGFDHGGAVPFPRSLNLASQILRALDGHSERFPAFFTTMNWWANVDNFDIPGNDNREAGYVQTFLGMLARATLVYDTGNHAQYCTWLHSYTPTWVSAMSASGYVGENIFRGSAPGYPYLDVSASAPSAAPWRSMVFAPWGMVWSYRALSDASDSSCYDNTMATNAYNTVALQTAAAYTYGLSTSNNGVYYNVNSLSNGNAGPSGGGYGGSGTVSATLGSAAVVGVGSAFLSQTSLCGGTNYIGIAGGGTGGVNNTVYRVSSCADDTHLTLAANYGTQSETGNASGVAWSSAPPTSTNCDSMATTCFTDVGSNPDGDRNLNRTMPGIESVSASLFGCSGCMAYAQTFFANTFGGPADGPGGSLPCAGSGCINTESDYVVTLRDCFTNGPPCGGGASPINGKPWGEGSGFPMADAFLAYLAGTSSSGSAVGGKLKMNNVVIH